MRLKSLSLAVIALVLISVQTACATPDSLKKLEQEKMKFDLFYGFALQGASEERIGPLEASFFPMCDAGFAKE